MHPIAWGIFVVVLIILFSFGALHVYHAALDQAFNLIKDFDKAAKIVLGVSGLVASFFLVYRSVTITRQTNEVIKQGERTERQLNKTERQLAETEQSNLTKMLTDAAKLLSSENRMEKYTGLAIVRTIGMKKDCIFP